MGLLVLLGPPEGVEPAVLGDHPVPLGVGVDHRQDAGPPGKRVPPCRSKVRSMGLSIYREPLGALAMVSGVPKNVGLQVPLDSSCSKVT